MGIRSFCLEGMEGTQNRPVWVIFPFFAKNSNKARVEIVYF